MFNSIIIHLNQWYTAVLMDDRSAHISEDQDAGDY